MASASMGIHMASTSQPPLKLALTVSPAVPTVSPAVPTVSPAVPTVSPTVPTVSPTVQPDSEGRLDNVCKPNFYGNQSKQSKPSIAVKQLSHCIN